MQSMRVIRTGKELPTAEPHLRLRADGSDPVPEKAFLAEQKKTWESSSRLSITLCSFPFFL